jgi:hypothetical protein
VSLAAVGLLATLLVLVGMSETRPVELADDEPDRSAA